MDFKKLKSRTPVAAGTLYPKSKLDLRNMVESLYETVQPKKEVKNIQALIVPHAGYVFSGKVAVQSYAHLNPLKKYKRIFILASSHFTSFDGASIFVGKNYSTPLGKVNVDMETTKELLNNGPYFEFHEYAHDKEFGIEVQLPFIQVKYKKPPPIVPIVICTRKEKVCEQIAHILSPYFTEDNLFIVSTDLSHFATYKEANIIDKWLCDALLTNDPHQFMNKRWRIINKKITNLQTPMCGWNAVLTFLHMSKQKDVNIELMDYKNSGDSDPFGSKDKVIGYGAFTISHNSKT